MENNINPMLLTIEVPETGIVSVSGTTYSPDERERILDIIKGVSGITEIRGAIAVMPAGV